jgi:hypothetical protein
VLYVDVGSADAMFCTFVLLYALLPIKQYVRSMANNVLKAMLICNENKIEIEIRIFVQFAKKKFKFEDGDGSRRKWC